MSKFMIKAKDIIKRLGSLLEENSSDLQDEDKLDEEPTIKVTKEIRQQMELLDILKEYKHLFAIDNLTIIFKKYIDEYLKDSPAIDKSQELKRTYEEHRKQSNNKRESRTIFIDFLKTKFLNEFSLYELDDGNRVSDTPILEEIPLREYAEIVDWILPFNNSKELTARDKFEILIYKNKKIDILGYDEAFKILKEKYPTFKKSKKINEFDNDWYEYNEYDVNDMYEQENLILTFKDKVDIVIGRLYAEMYGLGPIDILAYASINEVGFNKDGKFIYAWRREKIHLSFLKLESENDAMVIQERITEPHQHVGSLNLSNTEISCDRDDGARVTLTMYPYSSARLLRIRIFDVEDLSFNDIVGVPKLRFLIQTLVELGLNISAQGDLGAGKTTLLKAIQELLHDHIHIASAEDRFEQYSSRKYLNKSYAEFQTTESKSWYDVLATILRCSSDAASVGEARTGLAAHIFIQLAQAMKQSVFVTGHVASTDATVDRYVNMLMTTGLYPTKREAVYDIVNYLNIAIQQEIIDNKQTLASITEIVPLVQISSDVDLSTMSPKELHRRALIQQIQENTSYMYRLNTLIVLKHGEYRFENFPSDKIINKARVNERTWKYMQQLIKMIEEDTGVKYEWKEQRD